MDHMVFLQKFVIYKDFSWNFMKLNERKKVQNGRKSAQKNANRRKLEKCYQAVMSNIDKTGLIL